jgi:hypothetical protein
MVLPYCPRFCVLLFLSSLVQFCFFGWFIEMRECHRSLLVVLLKYVDVPNVVDGVWQNV